ncbi:MAG: hypothetical protein WCV85_06810 [Patescibacteria group bacterium]|jgi:hypothetical protein
MEKKIYVDPRHAEEAFDLDFWRDNKKLWNLEIPTEEMDIRELRWILEVPFWEDTDGNITIVPTDVLKNLDAYPEHRDRILQADTSFPIHIMPNRNGKWLTLDGLHRLAKLVLNGATKIRVKKVTREQVEKTKRDG